MDTRQTGITAAMVAVQPTAGAVLAELDTLLNRPPYLAVAHHAPTKADILRRYADFCPRLARSPMLDTVRLARVCYPELASHSLDALLTHLHITPAAGADVVLLIGPATASSVSAAVVAGGRLGVPILLDAPAASLTEKWIREMERLGIDGFTVTTNIDRGVRGQHPLDNARAIRDWSQLPVAVSGGFSPTDHDIIASRGWDILIIGRSIAEAVDPAQAAREIVDLVRARRTRS